MWWERRCNNDPTLFIFLNPRWFAARAPNSSLCPSIEFAPTTPRPTHKKMSSYYDIDTILAEEELIPSIALFDFSHLAYLDPDARHRESHLPEGSQIKMPLWALEKWSALGYVRMSLPRHYSRKARERLEADPGDADLR